MLNHLINNYGTILVFIIILSFLVSFVFYKLNTKNNKISIRIVFLMILRTLVFSIIGILILNPKLQQSKDVEIKKKVIVLADNSNSMPTTTYSKEKVQQFINNISTQLKTEVDIIPFAFDSEIKPFEKAKFQGKSTNISQAIKAIQHQFDSKELHSVVLLSDGIFNTSYHPKWINPAPEFPIYTVGYGDTTQYADLSIHHIKNNNIAFLGNEFPVEIHLKTKAWNTHKPKLLIKDKQGKIVHQFLWENPEKEDYKIHKFTLPAKRIGLNTYKVEVSSKETEQNIKNNVSSFTIDVLDVKNKILLVASETHPDHHAIHSALKGNLDYELDFKTLKEINNANLKTYDCVIFLGYQKETKSILEQCLNLNKNLLLKINRNSDLKNLAHSFPTYFDISNPKLDWDLAQNSVNSHFKGFNISKYTKDFLKTTPPLSVPFNTLKTKSSVQHILIQKVMNTTNKKGIFSLGAHNKSRIGLIQGEGLWKWRIQDFKKNESFENFDGFLKSMVRLVNIQNDKRLFHFNMPQNFLVDEELLIPAYLYNDSYEPITEDELLLNIETEEKIKYSFPFSKESKSYLCKFKLTEPGHYSYKVVNASKNNAILSQGVFNVKINEIENLNKVADFDVLRYISNTTDGFFYNHLEINKLVTDLQNKKSINTKVTLSENKPLIDKTWLLTLLLCFGLLEWFLRRQNSLQ